MTNIVISASQQRNNSCAIGDTEADHCQLIAEKVGEYIKDMANFVNVYVIPPQIGDDIPALRKVVNLSNIFTEQNGGKGYHLDIHTDAGGYATGASAFFVSEPGKAFMIPIFKNISDLTPWDDVGLRQRNDLMVLNQTAAISGLLEISFHDNQKEASWIHSNINNIANAIATGIIKALDIPPKEMSLEQCLLILQQNKVVKSPEYWIENAVPNGIVSGAFANVLIRNITRYVLQNKGGQSS